MGMLYPRTSVNRRGLAVDLTGIIDSGYKGYLMFPIHNNTSSQVIRLYPGERICQVIFERLNQPVKEGYRGRFKIRGNKKTSFTYLPEVNKEETKLIKEGKINKIKNNFPLIFA